MGPGDNAARPDDVQYNRQEEEGYTENPEGVAFLVAHLLEVWVLDVTAVPRGRADRRLRREMAAAKRQALAEFAHVKRDPEGNLWLQVAAGYTDLDERQVLSALLKRVELDLQKYEEACAVRAKRRRKRGAPGRHAPPIARRRLRAVTPGSSRRFAARTWVGKRRR